ncbi:hypothetical protein ACF1BP_34345 [Streptomyces sp. NPDC014735]
MPGELAVQVGHTELGRAYVQDPLVVGGQDSTGRQREGDSPVVWW